MAKYEVVKTIINMYPDEENSSVKNLNIPDKSSLECRIEDRANAPSTKCNFDMKFSNCAVPELEIIRLKSDGYQLTLPLHDTFSHSNIDRFALKGIDELRDDDYLKYTIMQLKKRTFLIDEVDISCVTKFHHNFEYGYGSGTASEKEGAVLIEEFDDKGNSTGKKYDIVDICPFCLNTEFLIISKSLADVYLDSLINNFGFVKIGSNLTLDDARMFKDLSGGNCVYVV